MSRNTLHITKLDEFKQWLDDQGIEHRPGKGAYQILQVRMKRNGFACVYDRHDMKEHYSVDRRIDGMVGRFCRDRRNNKGATEYV